MNSKTFKLKYRKSKTQVSRLLQWDYPELLKCVSVQTNKVSPVEWRETTTTTMKTTNTLFKYLMQFWQTPETNFIICPPQTPPKSRLHYGLMVTRERCTKYLWCVKSVYGLLGFIIVLWVARIFRFDDFFHQQLVKHFNVLTDRHQNISNLIIDLMERHRNALNPF